MRAVVTGLPITMVESSEVVSMAVLKGSSSDVNTKVSWSAGSGCSSICSSSSSSGWCPTHPGVESGNQEGYCDACWCLAHETPVLLGYWLLHCYLHRHLLRSWLLVESLMY